MSAVRGGADHVGSADSSASAAQPGGAAGPALAALADADAAVLTDTHGRPWLAHYAAGQATTLTPEHPTVVAAWASALAAHPDRIILRYFDGSFTLRQLDAAATAVAGALQADGFAAGDRLGLYTQNDPGFVIGLLAAWKAGGVAVAINPMNRARELRYLLEDSGAVALLCLDTLYQEVVAGVLAEGGTAVRQVLLTSGQDWQSRNDARVLAPRLEPAPDVAGVRQLRAVVAEARLPQVVPAPLPDDLAVLTYTSGTTGQPKGAMNTHGNLAFNAQTYRDWMGLTPEDSILGIAPLFHITGLVGHIAAALYTPCTLVLAHRFQPGVVLDALREHHPTFTIGAITAFIALMHDPQARREDFASLRAVYSGGAPIAPATRDQFAAFTGLAIHNAYGMTETTSPTHFVPLGAETPVDPVSGALSVGVPVYSTEVRIEGEDGNEAAPGEVGEILVRGPQVVPGYWQRTDATAEAMRGGFLHTGDVGFMDRDGWFYLVDRKKDMINAGGYKVWPREVEDVLYSHPSVREAAVVGVPDDYRGETVKAVIALKAGHELTEQELIAHCRANMAAYKVPRVVSFLDELPKTVTGKILRRELR